MALTKIDDRGLKTPVDLLDNEKIRFGTGNDLELYHDGSNSVLKEAGTGDLRIQTASFRLRNEDASEMMISADADGAVYLAHNGVTRFETTSTGANVIGKLDVSGDFKLNSATNAGQDIDWDESAGTLTCQDNVKLYFGAAGDLAIYHDGSHSFIKDGGQGNLKVLGSNLSLKNTADDKAYIDCIDAGAVEIYHNGTKKFETASGGVTVTGNAVATSKFRGNDDVKLSLGDGEDLQLHHDGSNSYVANSTGLLQLKNTAGNIDALAWNDVLLRVNAGELAVDCSANGSVDLYYDNSKRFETKDNGVRLTGNADCYQYMRAGGADGDCGFIFEDSAGNIDASFRFDTDDSYYQLVSGGADIIRIKGGASPDVMINTTSTDGGTSNGYIVATYDGSVKPIVKIRNTASSGSNYSMLFVRESTTAGGIYTTTSNTTVYETSSDYRLKENIVDLTNGITRVKQLKPRNYNWIVDETNEVVDGFLAHEAQAVVPTAVSGTKDQVNEDGTIKPQGIDQSMLVPLLTAALQEAITKIETLETKVAALEAA